MSDNRFDDYSSRGPRELAGMLIQMEDATKKAPAVAFLDALRFMPQRERIKALEAVFVGAEQRGWTPGPSEGGAS